jgi:exodeoxyribonuclease VII large subunit
MKRKMKNENYITISELNKLVKSCIVSGIETDINIKGEISNLKNSGNHLYFTLKDEEAMIHTIIWNGDANVKNGDSIIATGKLDVYIKSGIYQFIVKSFQKVGLGDLHYNYEKIKEEYKSKGYFNQKRLLNEELKEIGILTSYDGAAIHDILSVFSKNNFCGKIYIKNCIVQGEQCSKSICNGIKYFNTNYPQLDVLLISRGGGSFEDLMGFSDVNVLNEIYQSRIPTISAVGHEIDFMLSDFVADIRCPTPSVAGEYISSFYRKNVECVEYYKQEALKIYGRLQTQINEYNTKICSFIDILSLCSPKNKIETYLDKLNNIKNNMELDITNKLNECQNKITLLNNKFNEQHINDLLLKGFSVITDYNGKIILTKSQFKENRKNKEKMKIYFYDGIYKL